MCQLFRNLGASTSWKPQGLFRPVMGLKKNLEDLDIDRQVILKLEQMFWEKRG
jgi:hypothetical protein